MMRKSMQKLIRAMMAGLLLAGFSIGLAGCGEESGVTAKTEIKGPGGTTTITDKETVKKTGQNPPAAPGETTAH
jgi:hypothetical protein